MQNAGRSPEKWKSYKYFNVQGKQYEFIAKGEYGNDFGVLHENGKLFLNTLHQYIGTASKDQKPEERPVLYGASAVLERLESALLSSSRIGSEVPRIIKYGLDIPPRQMLSLRLQKALIDFESLLFHGGAALGRLTKFILEIGHGHKNCDRYSKIVNVLKQFSSKDQRAENMLKHIKIAAPAFDGILIDPPKGRSLRSRQIHLAGILENTLAQLTIHNDTTKGVLFLDTHLLDYPVFGTAHKLTQYLAYIIMNGVAIYLNKKERLHPKDCIPNWQNIFVDIRPFISQDQKGIAVTQPRFEPAGVCINTFFLKRSILNQAIKPGKLQRVLDNIYKKKKNEKTNQDSC